MLGNVQLMIMYRAIKIRMKNGEELEDIFDSYKKLTDEDKEALRKKFE